MYALGDVDQLASCCDNERQSRRPARHEVAVPVQSTSAASALNFCHSTNVVVSFRHRQSLAVGVSRLVLGLLCLVFNVVSICYIDQVGWVVYVTGNGFWTGCAVSECIATVICRIILPLIVISRYLTGRFKFHF